MPRTIHWARRGRGTKQVNPSERGQKQVATGERGEKRKLSESDDSNPRHLARRYVPANKSEESLSPAAVADPALLSDHFAKYILKWFPESSTIELEDRYLPTKAFLDTTSYDRDRVAENLPDFLERFSAGSKEALSTCDEVATPHTLVLTISGMRTADLARQLQVFKSEDCKVGKFIAKHMKLEMNAEFLRQYKVTIAMGTPGRLNQLLEAGAMKTEGLQRIVVDGSYRDAKNSSIFTNGQIFRPMLALLNNDSIRQRYGAEHHKIDLLVF
ncbi:hypothetical protein AYL99_07233 [Fonsecaea erecta]|uniref:Protein CMS1 n=1 Tax=Fonsecaea erecta TaxID=1367422 RepID=A0A178ZG26_9EURO|nr:hypothetical protein AYL99_07233 [Fonsecaea erecta]OAP58143.1 hypothetical protein AYL99_07233 [Fonsecaea erecta]